MVRDDAGIAHITADSTHDLFFAQGYGHASERMWQMEVWRHISAGRLSELFGESQLDTDRFIRTLGWRQAAERDLDATGDAARRVLDGARLVITTGQAGNPFDRHYNDQVDPVAERRDGGAPIHGASHRAGRGVDPHPDTLRSAARRRDGRGLAVG